MRGINRALLAAACATFGACSDELSAPPELDQDLTDAGRYVDIQTQPRFKIDVTVEGNLTPGSPIRVTATIRTLVATDEFDVRLWAPEVEVARRSQWEEMRIPVGERLPALSTSRATVSLGGEVVESATINVPVAGYYRVIASAVARPGQSALPNVQDEVHQEVWLFVSRDGGRVTRLFEPSLLPDGALPSPGPIRYPRREPGPTSQNAPLAMGTPRLDYIPTQDDGDDVHEGRVLYVHPITQEYLPLAGVLMWVEIFDGYEGRYTGSYGSATTDATGYFEFNQCPWTGGVEQYHGFIELNDGNVLVDHYRGPYFSLCYDSDVIIASDAAIVYTNMQATIAASRTLLQKSRGRIWVWINSDGSKYQSSWDRILIHPNDVGGPRGVFVTAHEYGHAVHEKALGGNTTSGQCPSPHYLDSPHGLGCALSEGFANWHSAVTRGFAAQNTAAFAANSFYPGVRRHPFDGSPYDGAMIEGVVAAFLYDLTDPANDESFDFVSYPASYIAQIFHTCRVQLSTWSRARDIGHMIYCFERAVDPTVRSSSTYWPNGSDPGAQTETAIEPPNWDRGGIRRLWLKNLYNETWSGTFGSLIAGAGPWNP